MLKDVLYSERSELLFVIPPSQHSSEEILAQLNQHPEIRYVSLVGVDLGGNDTDEKIPVDLFKKNIMGFLTGGVQTDGSSVVLPEIASLNNARVDIIPDPSVNWFVDYNFDNIDPFTDRPVGTLRIPSFLIHNGIQKVDSRSVLQSAINHFKAEMISLLKNNSSLLSYFNISSADEIEDIILTSATELEFWVKTPDDKGQ